VRAGLLYSMAGGSNGAIFTVRGMQNTYLRDFFLRSAWNGATYNLDAYRTKDEAINQQSRLAFATHATGTNVIVPMTVDGAAPFNATPMTVIVDAVGTWTSAICGWEAGVQAAILHRMDAILARYVLPNEALAGLNYVGVGLLLPATLPAVGIMPGPVTVLRETNANFVLNIGVDLYAASEGADNPSAIYDVIRYGETLRSIVLDEQLQWTGFAISTVGSGAIEATTTQDVLVYKVTVPVAMEMPGLYAERAPGEGAFGLGGKYAAGLT
jgi:hypothetical protein